MAAVVIAATSFAWAPGVFGDQTPALVGAVVLAAMGYSFVASISGALYGVRNWRGVAGMTVLDSALRLILVAAAVTEGWESRPRDTPSRSPFALAAMILWLATGRGIRERLVLDSDLPTLLRNSLHTVGASVATGVMISGLPFLLGVTSSGIDARTLASLILVITLSRAPLVIPLLAIQSYLIVSFRDGTDRILQRVITWTMGLLLVTAVLALLAVVVGPWALGALYGDRYFLEPVAYAAIVASAGLTGALCITGPALLSARRHTTYLAGWATASLVTVVLLVLPIEGLARVFCALVIGPIVGLIVHASGLRPGRSVTA